MALIHTEQFNLMSKSVLVKVKKTRWSKENDHATNTCLSSLPRAVLQYEYNFISITTCIYKHFWLCYKVKKQKLKFTSFERFVDLENCRVSFFKPAGGVIDNSNNSVYQETFYKAWWAHFVLWWLTGTGTSGKKPEKRIFTYV